jgi:hypothetical protein
MELIFVATHSSFSDTVSRATTFGAKFSVVEISNIEENVGQQSESMVLPGVSSFYKWLHTLYPIPGRFNLLFCFSNRYLNTYSARTTPIQNSVWRLFCIESFDI